MIPVERFKCENCGVTYESEVNALQCEFKHARAAYANALLEKNYSLSYINRACGFGWELKDEQKDITQDNCFVESYLQSCNKPAYRIVKIENDGKLKLWGCGSWSGYYGTTISVSKLPAPHSKEELFIDPRYEM